LSGSRFDRTAERYAEAARQKDWRSFVEFCRPQPGDRALDVGAGPAILSGALASSVAQAVAVDVSEAMLAQAPPGVSTVVGKAERLPFDDRGFTLVTCVNTLHHVEDPGAVLKEMVRVLAPGGRLVVQDYLADHDPDQAQRWETVERLRDPGHERLPRDGEVQQALRQHGVFLDEERTWESAWDLEPWIEMASPPEADAERIRRLVGADRFALRAWRGRFVSRPA
jgi:SAM-dependent methyltransferase